MPDVLAELQAAIDHGMRGRNGPVSLGTADSDVNVLVRTVPLRVLDRAMAEIRELRAKTILVASLAGFKEIVPNG